MILKKVNELFATGLQMDDQVVNLLLNFHLIMDLISNID